MFPASPPQAHPATRLWQVERDGNPLRRFGHVSPFIGKLAPVDARSLDQIGLLTRMALPDLPEPTLVIGMTESSLLLAFFMARWQQKPVDLKFTTRQIRQSEAKIDFREPHSHGPQHFLALEPGKQYAQIVVIEDELTTGATLRNLLLALENVSKRVFVATLRDLRPQSMRDDLTNELAEHGIELETLALESLDVSLDEDIIPVCPIFNPFGRLENDRVAALETLQNEFAEFKPGAIYMIGECVDIALQFALQLPEDERPELRQITRSPWKVDGDHVHSAYKFASDGTGSNYFIYNFVPPQNGRVLWIGETSNSVVGAQAEEFLKSQGVESRGILVAGG
ncbi:hypothetical protein IAD21_04140 [Abditibacteriota bacterium]|nr:hypothetical protein IAD21_04140 [Abditibacteriota bacterium]